MTGHDGAAWILLEGLDGRAGKAAIEDAIAVEEENEIRARPAAQRLVQAFIAASCGGERSGRIELDHGHAELPRDRWTAVVRP